MSKKSIKQIMVDFRHLIETENISSVRQAAGLLHVRVDGARIAALELAAQGLIFKDSEGFFRPDSPEFQEERVLRAVAAIPTSESAEAVADIAAVPVSTVLDMLERGVIAKNDIGVWYQARGREGRCAPCHARCYTSKDYVGRIPEGGDPGSGYVSGQIREGL